MLALLEKREWIVLLFAIAWLGAAGCSTLPQKTLARHHPHAALSSELRIGTYNVFIGTRDLARTVAVIRQMNADVVALQEVAPRSAVILGSEFSRDYPHRYFSAGLGLMSRFPLRRPRFQRSRRGINGFLLAEIDHRWGHLQIANLHLDPLRIWTIQEKLTLPFQLGRQGNIHRDELAQAFENLRGDVPTILLGDFNRANDAAINRLREIGFVDSFAAVTPRPDRIPTLHYSMLGFRSGRRIDFIFHDGTFHTVSSQVLSGQPSDHDAVVSVLRFQHGRRERQNDD
jgi:endonuclease/exonuclease/phosphatase (EEP) superfamily protein YafD